MATSSIKIPAHKKTSQRRSRRREQRKSNSEAITPEFVRALRKRLGWSASRFAIEVGGHTRSCIKSIEGGSLPVSRSLAEEIRALQRKMFPRRKSRRRYWRTIFVIFV